MSSHPFLFSTTPIELAIGTLVLLISSALPGIAQSDWVPQESGTPNPLTGVAFGAGQFVAVGEPGIILTSPDGMNWTEQTSGTAQALRGITYGNGLFVATGSAGTALTSPDGINWTSQTTSTPNLLSGVAFGNGRFVAVGGSGTIRFSDDGVTWETATAPTTTFLQGATFGGGRFVAVGRGRIIYSTDGQTWTTASGTLSTHFYTAPSFMGGKYVVVGLFGVIATSDDATVWTTQPVVALTNLRSIANNGSQFVVTGDPLPQDSQAAKILTSPDGVSWDVMDLDVDVELFSIAYGECMYVIVGPQDPTDGLVLSSLDDQIPRLTFEAWRQLVFTPAELADPLISGAGADPDSDGIPNFPEYALGLPPKLRDEHQALAQISKDLSAANEVAITFTRPIDRFCEVTYAISYSTDLSTWTNLDVEEEIIAMTNGIQTVRFVDPGASQRAKFYRIDFSSG